MRDTIKFDTADELVKGLFDLVIKHGDITIEAIYPPGTPTSEISLAHTQETTKNFLVKFTYGI